MEGLVNALCDANFSSYRWKVPLHAILLQQKHFAPMGSHKLERFVVSSGFKKGLAGFKEGLKRVFQERFGLEGVAGSGTPPMSLYSPNSSSQVVGLAFSSCRHLRAFQKMCSMLVSVRLSLSLGIVVAMLVGGRAWRSNPTPNVKQSLLGHSGASNTEGGALRPSFWMPA